jgi:hypothetical protein
MGVRVSEPGVGSDRVKTPVSAPKARNVKAWAIGPGGSVEIFLALKARNMAGPFIISAIRATRTYFALSALLRSEPWALPQAVTFRAVGAATRSFHTISVASGSGLVGGYADQSDSLSRG